MDLTLRELGTLPPGFLAVFAAIEELSGGEWVEITNGELERLTSRHGGRIRLIIRDLVDTGAIEKEIFGGGDRNRPRRALRSLGITSWHAETFRRLLAGEVQRCRAELSSKGYKCRRLAIEGPGGRPCGQWCPVHRNTERADIHWLDKFKRMATDLVAGRNPPHLRSSEFNHLCYVTGAPRLTFRRHGAEIDTPGAIETACDHGWLPAAEWREYHRRARLGDDDDVWSTPL